MEQLTLRQYAELTSIPEVTVRVWISRNQEFRLDGVVKKEKLGGAWFLTVDKRKLKNNVK